LRIVALVRRAIAWLVAGRSPVWALPRDGVSRGDRAGDRLCTWWDVDACDVPRRDLIDVEPGDLAGREPGEERPGSAAAIAIVASMSRSAWRALGLAWRHPVVALRTCR
jgi:hypothetical protein